MENKGFKIGLIIMIVGLICAGVSIIVGVKWLAVTLIFSGFVLVFWGFMMMLTFEENKKKLLDDLLNKDDGTT